MIKIYPYYEFSGAVQQKTTTHIKKPNEVRNALNADFSTILGAMRRRKGMQSTEYDLPALPDSKPALGAYIARFPAGNEIWAINNIAAGTSAKLKRWVGPDFDDWTDIQTSLTASAEFNITDDLDEIWVSEYNPTTDAIGDPFTVDSAHSVSTTRLLSFAPAARFYMEFAGSMWAFNVRIGSGGSAVRYRDRFYKSSGPTGAFSYVRAATTMTQTAAVPTAYLAPLEVDSARYIKATQVVDIYSAASDTKLYTLTVASVDKALDTVTFATPDTLTFAYTDITTATDVITVSNVAWLVTGYPVTFWQGTALPGGLTQGGVYYVNRVNTTSIKLYTTRALALVGGATGLVDITSQGTGTHRVTFTPVFGNKDEFWVTDRKNKLTRLWNIDYRQPESADWEKIPATLDAGNDITAVGKISNRMFIFTNNAIIKYDGQNIVPLRNDVGCVAHKTIGYYDTYMIWLDAKGQVWVRNEDAGTQDVISQAIRDVIALVDQDELVHATAVCVGSTYKLYLGQVNGKSIRVVYDFLSNQWAVDEFAPQPLAQLEYIYDGIARPHFFDEEGQMWVDEEGDDDNGVIIPFDVELGEDTFGVEAIKQYKGVKVYSKNATATKVMVAIDGGDWIDVGQITRRIQSIDFINKIPNGTIFNMRFVNSVPGDPPEIHKAAVYYSQEEDTFRATK